MTTDNTASAGQLGAGQQDPNDTAAEVNKIDFAVRRILAEMDSMQPVKVIAVHLGSGTPPGPATVDVQPLVSRVDGNMNAIEEGTVYGIPCQRLQGGPWSIVCDPAVGDFGFVVAADRDISRVKASPGTGAPGSSRRYSIADGIYVGAVLNKATKAYLWLKSDGSYVLNDGFGNVLQSSSSGFTATPAGGGTFTVNGPIHSTGAIIAGFGTGDQVGVQSHTHTGNNVPPTPGS